jgi:hypothetical protein
VVVLVLVVVVVLVVVLVVMIVGLAHGRDSVPASTRQAGKSRRIQCASSGSRR